MYYKHINGRKTVAVVAVYFTLVRCADGITTTVLIPRRRSAEPASRQSSSPARSSESPDRRLFLARRCPTSQTRRPFHADEPRVPISRGDVLPEPGLICWAVPVSVSRRPRSQTLLGSCRGRVLGTEFRRQRRRSGGFLSVVVPRRPYNNTTVAEWLARLTAVWEDPGLNHTADGCVYRESRCDMQPGERAVHHYCTA